MVFQPSIPASGLLGWRFLQRTQEAQKETLNQAPEVKRNTEHFREKIGDIDSAEALVADRALLQVALGAFGLQEDLNNKFFIQKILEDGPSDPDALANRLADKRYLEFTRAFGFKQPGGPLSKLSGFADRIISDYQDRSFEIAVGDQNNDLRLALSLERDLGAIANRPVSNDTKWFTIMGNPPLRKVFEQAFSLPPSFATLPIDNQLEALKDRASSVFGSDDVSLFSSGSDREQLIQQFLLRSDLSNNFDYSPGANALAILSSF